MEDVGFFRHEPWLTVIFAISYLAVFVCGLFGNLFVVLAVAFHRQLRTTTDYLISSLAVADLLVMVFCLPSTLLNSIVTEWLLGAAICKLSTWINSTTSCASIYTLVAVTADRYFAICHTMRYAVWDASYTLWVIACIWLVSGAMSAPTLFTFDEVIFVAEYDWNVTLCSDTAEFAMEMFVVVNLTLAFIFPFLLIIVFYTLIFYTISTRRSLAVNSQMRDERVKLRVAHMMLTVIVVFAMCWVPLYGVYCFYFFVSDISWMIINVLRPLFQWLALLSSSINPLIYVAYSHKYRRAFHRLLVAPCRSRYEKVRNTTLTTADGGGNRLGVERRDESSVLSWHASCNG